MGYRMQIKFDVKTIIFILIFLILKKEDIYLIFLIYAIVHELIHVITGIVLGMKPHVLNIMPFGASISFKEDINSYNKKIIRGNVNNIKRLLIAITAPLFNIVLGTLFSFNSKYILITYINIILALFNLLPIYPLDGGRIIKEILTILYGRRKALEYINTISNITLTIICIFCIIFCYMSRSILLLISIIYLIYIRRKENQIYRIRKRVYVILEKSEY